jgi:cytochrome b subunit of formate dehydrogenase
MTAVMKCGPDSVNRRLAAVAGFALLLGVSAAGHPVGAEEPASIDNATCFSCHGDAAASRFVDAQPFDASAHAGAQCTSCHSDLAQSEWPHHVPVAPVQCGACHAPQQGEFAESLHGKALARGDTLAPQCQSCHGSHDILPVADKHSQVSPLRIPFVCGSCHSEGTPVQRQRNIHQDHIIENYSESIHGEGLFKKGLNVSATCVSCHGAHRILPHTDPRSPIAKANVANTCEQCHAQIEVVHRKVVGGELWQKNPQSVPVCVECHQPHKARKVFYDQGVADQDCLMCHGKPDVVASVDGRSLFVNADQLKGSTHAKVSCARCHTEVSPDHQRACETIKRRVDCAVCHSEQVEQYKGSTHGALHAQGEAKAPNCRDCHGTHGMLGKSDVTSPTFPTNVPKLCASCHQETGKAAMRYKGAQHNIDTNYVESIHGKGLLKSGLVVTAMCTNCHTAHQMLPASDPQSSVNPKNIAVTCSKCHKGVYEQYARSIHAPGQAKSEKQLPACNDCHTAHTIKRTDQNNFRFEVMDACGKCHQDIAKTYFDTFHGKVSKLGYAKAAKCHDCHGAHDILPVSDTGSHLSRRNIVATCQRCHAGATRRFAGYLTHATHHDSSKYPLIFWTFWSMTSLLVGTFAASGLHTLLWLSRSLEIRRANPPAPHEPGKKQYVRFTFLNRVLHGTMIVSFLTLATTGMTLKFSYTKWAMALSHLLGGVEVSGFLHRCAAVMLVGLFSVHVWDLLKGKRRSGISWKQMLFGPQTMLLTLQDLREVLATLKWYLRKGPRPKYGRWTYWEKFDYFAVFWGIVVIGSTGLMLWFPEAFTHVLPGWMINVATIIHSDEALLAAGFIFTIHFFNTHFRPEKFPMDTVIFTGRMSLEELKRERPAEYEALVASGELERHLADPLPPHVVRALRVFAWTALVIGLTLVVGIIYAMVFAYK